MLIKLLKILILSMTVCSLTACVHMSGLSKSQVKMLQKEGFVLTEEGWNLNLPARILFDFNSADIKEENKDELIAFAKKLQKYKLVRLKVIGHTDNVGTAEYNQALSEERAQSVSNLFVESGYLPSNLQVIGRGMSQPVVDNDTEEHRAENRRVAIVIVP